MSAFLRCLAALAFLGLAETASAGTWSRFEAADMDNCSLLFEGPIAKGDLTRAVEDGLLDDFAPRICLNSPGGSLGEVLAFLDASEHGPNPFYFGTRVRSGEECLSSCAILFMFGQAFGANSPYPSRQLEPGARLGFHSPFIRDGANPAASDAEVFDVALRVAKLLADRSYKATTTSGPALPPELLALVLGTPSAGMRYVETIGEARLMNIELTHDLESRAVFEDRPEVIDRLFRQICISSHTLTYRHHMVNEGYDFAPLLERATDPEYYTSDTEIVARDRTPAEGYSPEILRAALTGPGYFLPGWYSVGSMMYCRIEMAIERAPGRFTVKHYSASFDFITSADLSRVPEPSSTIGNVVSAGLLPLDTLY